MAQIFVHTHVGRWLQRFLQQKLTVSLSISSKGAVLEEKKKWKLDNYLISKL